MGKKRLLFVVALALPLAIAGFVLRYSFARLGRSLSLSGEWEVCVSPSSDSDHCSWTKWRIPDSSNLFSSGRFGTYRGWIHYRKKIEPPRYCLAPSDGCSLFLAEVGDALKVSVDGHFVGMHGSFSPEFQYKKNHPVNIFIPSSDLSKASQVELELTSFSPKRSLIGVRLAPFLLTDTSTAQIFEFYILLRNIILPLLVAGLLLLMGIATFFIYETAIVVDREVRAYLVFITVNVFFLVSMSEVPREFLPLGLLGFVHYLLRTAYDWSLFNLLACVEVVAPRFRKTVHALFFLGIATFLFLMFGTLVHPMLVLGMGGFDLAYILMRILVPLVLLPGFLGALGKYKDAETYRPLKVAMVLTLPLLISDVLAFHNVIAATYTVKFYPLLIGAAFGWILLKRHLKEQALLAVLKEKELIYKQVSHDIRSPLSALNHVMSIVSELPESKRVLIRAAINRVNDIANQLLYRPLRGEGDEPARGAQLIQIGALVDGLVSEKRLSVHEKLDLTITASLSSSYGLFSTIDPVELKRALSNLIDNAIEAVADGVGVVDVCVEPVDDEIALSVTDNGRGIPAPLMSRLGAPGVTFGKTGTQSGAGLGVYHAKKTIESAGGRFEIRSREGEGTSIVMRLGRQRPPSWFVSSLRLRPGQTVVVVDDDSSVLEFWKTRFADMVTSGQIRLMRFPSGNALRGWLKDRERNSEPVTYLIDFELIDQEQTGLDLIRDLRLTGAYLVTSRYEETTVRAECERLGVRLVPKGIASFVPIEFRDEVPLDLVILDDDPMVKLSWELAAGDANKRIRYFSELSAFLHAREAIPKETPIFVDLDLGPQNTGLEAAKQIHALGYSEIHLATGHDREEIDCPEFIASVVGKGFPLL